MIQMQTTLAAADNSGAKELMCIKVLGGSKRRYAGIGDVIKVSIREAGTFNFSSTFEMSFQRFALALPSDR